MYLSIRRNSEYACLPLLFSSFNVPLRVLTLRQTSPTPVITQAFAVYLPQCGEHKRSVYNANYKAEVVISQQSGCSTWTHSSSQGAHPSFQVYLSGCQQMPTAHAGAHGTEPVLAPRCLFPTHTRRLTPQLAAFLEQLRIVLAVLHHGKSVI